MSQTAPRAVVLDLPTCMSRLAWRVGSEPKAQAHWAFAQETLDKAEAALEPFQGAAKVGSICQSSFAGRLENGCKVHGRGAALRMVRQEHGWELADCQERNIASSTPSTTGLHCAAYLAMGEFNLPSKKGLVQIEGWIRQGLMGVDEPLPAHRLSAHPPEPASAMGVACEHGWLAWVELLLSLGADPNGASAYGKRPLHFCALNPHRSGSAPSVLALERAGADFRAKSRAGKIPVDTIPKHLSGLATCEAVQLIRSRAATLLEAKRIGAAAKAPTPAPAPARRSAL